MNGLLALGAVAVMALSLLLIPLGIPGLWIMVGVVAAGLAAGQISLGIFLLLLGVAVAAELAEWVSVDRLSRRYGGSTRTFWGALLGGAVGVVVGAPVPVAGSLIGAFVGTLAGAVLATWLETRRVGGSLRAGWGALLGRTVAVGVKVFAGLVILVLGGGAFLF
ncbi:MAG TPA: DUF456 family protein [Gemmatimonadota bacterium]|nr:DUF456 family protein [Gemmatimonadota bacterium]